MADLDLLRSFMGIYRAGTLSGAANQLGFTQPALSHHLKALETQLGRPLFDRLPRGLAPTPVAHALAQSLGPHMDAVVATVEAARVGTGLVPGPLHLGGPAELIATKVLPTLCLCTIWQSGIQLRIHTGAFEEQLRALKDGSLDVLISPRGISGRGLQVEPLYQETLILVGAPRWVRPVRPRASAPAGAAPVAGIPWIACHEVEPDPLQSYFQAMFGSEPSAPPSLVVDDLRAALAAAVGGLGATVLPSYLCEEALLRGELQRLHEPDVPLTRALHLVRKKSLKANARLDLVWKLLRKAAEGW